MSQKNMGSKIPSLNGDGTKNPNLLRKSNPVNNTTKTNVSSGMSGGTGGNPDGTRTNKTTMTQRAISTGSSKFKMGTTMHAAGTVPQYLKGK